MELISHPSGKEFLDYNREVLEEKEAENNLILGLATTLQKDIFHYGEDRPHLISILHQQESVFCCLQTPPKSMIIYAKDEYLNNSIQILCDYLSKENIELPGISGSKATSLKFAEAWSSLRGCSYGLKMNMRIYRLDTIRDLPFSEGIFRLAKESDQKMIADWIYIFNKEIFDQDDLVGSKNEARNKIMNKEIYIFETDVPVCMSACARPTRNGITINYVYTPDEYRKQGYATSCVSALSRLMLKKYKFCSLFTDLNNPTSNKIYQSIGYYPVDDYQEYEFH